MAELKDSKTILKAKRGVSYKWTAVGTLADFSAENLQARRECHVILIVQKGKTKKKN